MALGAAVAVAVAVGASAAPAAGPLPVVPRDCVHEAVKPPRIVVACGDGNFFLTGLKWSSWGRHSAKATGTGHLNDCNPACFNGHFHKYPVAVRLSRPRACSGSQRPQFRRIVVTYTGRKPAGVKRTDREPVACPA